MKGFEGFPRHTEFTPIPNLFLTKLLPQIRDLAEARVTLHLFWLLYHKKGYPRYAALGELLAAPALLAGLEGDGSPEEALRCGLRAAVERGTLLRLVLQRDGEEEELYFTNTDEGRRAVSDIEGGRVKIARMSPAPTPAPAAELLSIFALYEQNIGLLSPIIAEELKEAEQTYPASWIQDAFREAASLNKRSWRYIARILERWAREGKDDGELRRDSEAHHDPREYLKRYRHLIKG